VIARPNQIQANAERIANLRAPAPTRLMTPCARSALRYVRLTTYWSCV
jgi:hypothetical protein